VVLLVSRLNLAFLSPKLSRNIDKILVASVPVDSITLRILLGESCYHGICTLADYSVWLNDRQHPGAPFNKVVLPLCLERLSAFLTDAIDFLP
jgi:hypothetical protein